MGMLTAFQQRSNEILILGTSFLCIMNSKKEKLEGRVEHCSLPVLRVILWPYSGSMKVYTSDMSRPLQCLRFSGNDGQERKLTANCKTASVTMLGREGDVTDSREMGCV